MCHEHSEPHVETFYLVSLIYMHVRCYNILVICISCYTNIPLSGHIVDRCLL